MNNRQFKAVIFDLDGTLLDTLNDLANAYNRALAHMGFPIHPIEAYRCFVGDGARKCVIRALPVDARDAATVDHCLQLFRKDYSQNWNIFTKPYRGIPETLTALSDRQIRMAILSNKPHDNTIQCASAYFSRWRFSVVFGQKDTIPMKPDPSSSLAIASQLNISPEKILFLGDTATDMKTAIAAGMFPVGALWGFRTKDELKSNGARTTIGKPEELIRLFTP